MTSARTWAGTVAAAAGLLAVLGGLGDSAVVPGLGPHPGPPWDLAAQPGPWPVTLLAACAYLVGGAAVLAGLRAVAGGSRPAPARVALAAVVAVVALTSVPAAGSADHLSYVAYGRIAAAGEDPYATSPGAWRGGTDPVAGAVQPPWQDTPSVYGPVATALHAAVAMAGGGSLRLSVWWWQLLCGAAFLSVAGVLDRLARPDPARRARVAVLWTLNPVLLGQLVLGAHVDVVAAAFAVAGLAAAASARPPALAPSVLLVRALAAGLLLGAAVMVKAPYALFGLAAVWGFRAERPSRLAIATGAGAVGALAVVVPAQLWAGPHALDQLGRASRFTSLATPWRALANLGDLVLGRGALNSVVVPVALLLAAGLGVLLWRGRTAGLDCPGPAPDAVRAAAALTVAWTLTAPYALPWYDAMVWAPLALVAPSVLDRLLLLRLTTLALAYVPGRVVGLTPSVEAVTLGVRTYLAPVVVLAVIVAVVRWAIAGVTESGVSGARPAGRR